jgi:hypothetical protein
MERTLISFNFPNVVTVTLMAALGYMLLAVVSQVIQQRSG